MRHRFSIRNTAGEASRGSVRGFSVGERGGGHPPPSERQVGALYRRLRGPVRSRARGSCGLELFILELSDHLRWWAHGALGNRGRLEGGQYLAGRRAPPLSLA